jgi:hypothetical protein
VSNHLTTLENIEAVQCQLEAKRGEQVELRREFKVTKQMKLQSKIIANCLWIAKAEHWLAGERVRNMNMAGKRTVGN